MIKIKGLVNNEVYKEIFQQVVDSERDDVVCVVIGSFTGSATCTLGQMLKEAGKGFFIFTIDDNQYTNISESTHEWMEQSDGFHDKLVENLLLCGLDDDDVKIMVGDSIELSKGFADDSLDFIFLDGSHYNPYVTREILAWLPKMRKNSLLSGHDYPAIFNAVSDALPNMYIQPISDKSSYFVKLGEGL